MTSAAAIPTVTLNDDNTMPVIGLGVGELSEAETEQAVSAALEAGYRMIDTAAAYGNEAAVGRAVAASGIARDELFITTKLATEDQGFQSSQDALRRSLERLGLDYVDLYLIHWPNPRVDQYVDTWRAMVRLQEEGRVGSIGVSNFTPEYLTRVADATGVMPALNQVELHPFFPQVELRAFHEQHGIVTEAWSPLGKAAPVKESAPVADAAAAHGVTPAQVILRWHQQVGSLPIPKSGSPDRQRENLDLGGFTLTDEEVAAITALGRPDGRLFGGDPTTHQEM